jgi:hypothetical protein
MTHNSSRKYRRVHLSARTVTNKRRHCNMLLSRKVYKNIKEYQSGKAFYSARQPIAVAYQQIRKMHPECSRYYKRTIKKNIRKRSHRSRR